MKMKYFIEGDSWPGGMHLQIVSNQNLLLQHEEEDGFCNNKIVAKVPYLNLNHRRLPRPHPLLVIVISTSILLRLGQHELAISSDEYWISNPHIYSRGGLAEETTANGDNTV